MKLKINSKWDRKRETIWKMKANGNEIEPRVNKKKDVKLKIITQLARGRDEKPVKTERPGPVSFLWFSIFSLFSTAERDVAK